MRAQAGNRLCFPGEEVVPAKSEGELAEVCRGKLVHSGHIQALDGTLTRVVIKRLDEDHVIKFITMYRGIEWIRLEKQLSVILS